MHYRAGPCDWQKAHERKMKSMREREREREGKHARDRKGKQMGGEGEVHI